MDIPRYWEVISRHRLIALGGVVTSVALVVAWAQLTERTYRATASVLVTQEARQPLGNSAVVDPSRFAYLAQFYARLAGSDAIKHLAKRLDPNLGHYATGIDRSADGTVLPVISITSEASSAASAITSANAVASALKKSLRAAQTSDGVPTRARVELSVIESAEGNLVPSGRATRAAMLFLLGLVVTALALAVVENVQLARSQLLPDLGAPTPEEGDDSPLSLPARLDVRSSEPTRLDVGSSRSETRRRGGVPTLGEGKDHSGSRGVQRTRG